MPKKGYDLRNLQRAVRTFRLEPRSRYTACKLQDELNKFFIEAKCVSIQYTENDKLFFGMMVYPYITDECAKKIASGVAETKEDLLVKEYSIDVDSKLFTSVMLSDREITAILLHEVGHLVCDDSPGKIVQRNMDAFFAKNRTQYKNDGYLKVVKFGIQDAMVKSVSVWYRDEEVAADSFVVACGYGPELESALRTISGSAWSIARGSNVPKYVMLYWALRVYTDIGVKRVSAIRTLDKAIGLEGSTLFKNNMKDLRNSIMNYIDNKNHQDELLPADGSQGNYMNEGRLFNTFRSAGLRTLDNDVYEFRMRINNVETELDALQLLREINNHMSTLAGLIESPKITETERERYEKLYAEYDVIRNELSKKKIWKRSQYGLFYDYNSLSDRDMRRYEPY